MHTKKSDRPIDTKFIFVTCIISLVLSLLYLYKGFKEDMNYKTLIVVGLNFLYIPFALIFKKKGFSYFYLFYSVVLIFIASFNKTYLYNNFTYLFMICIIFLLQPHLKMPAIIIYFVAVTVAYVLNEEEIYHYLIHITRAFWFLYIFDYVIGGKYKRKKLLLYDDEIKILTQLSKNHLQKSIEFEGYSESTIYRRLKSAMKRNNVSKHELLEIFKREYEEHTNELILTEK